MENKENPNQLSSAGPLILIIIALVWFGFVADRTKEYGKKHILISLDDHQRMDELIKPNSLLFMGDSHVSSIPVSQYFDDSVNLGIGYQTSVELLEYISKYQSVKSARTIVLSIGTNDLILNNDKDFIFRFARILQAIPSNTRVIVNTVPPVIRFKNENNWVNRTNRMNLEIKAVCAKFKNCRAYDLHQSLSDSGLSIEKVFDPDGIHLSKASYDIWLRDLQELVK